MTKAKGERVEKVSGSHQNHRSGHHSASSSKPSKGKSFKDIGPRFADARKGTYVGHLDKIKQRLIHKAKVKKAYHRTLSREATAKGSRNDVDSPGSLEGDDLMQGKASDLDNDQELDNSMEVDTPRSTQFPSGSLSPSESLRKRKASEELEEVVAHEPAPEASTSQAPYIHPSRRTGQLRPKKPAKEPATLRQPKKAKRTPEEIEQLRQRRERERQSWARKTKKGQPNLNARMDVLLSKIERSVGQ